MNLPEIKVQITSLDDVIRKLLIIVKGLEKAGAKPLSTILEEKTKSLESFRRRIVKNIFEPK